MERTTENGYKERRLKKRKLNKLFVLTLMQRGQIDNRD